MGRFDDAESLEQAVYRAIGAASMCWENVKGAGVFDSIEAQSVAEDLLSAIRGWMDDVDINTGSAPRPAMPETIKAEEARRSAE